MVDKELDLRVDENNLLNEWQGQAQLMYDYSKELADAMELEDEAKANLAVVVAELDRKIRSNPTKFGLAKATDSVVGNAIAGQPDHEVAMKQVIKARHRARVLKAAVDSIQHRKSTLQGMTDLFLRQWYADPTSTAQPTELKDAANKVVTVTRRRRRRPER